jgi:hypothetical protein
MDGSLKSCGKYEVEVLPATGWQAQSLARDDGD